MGDFSFPKVEQAELPLQNPLLAKATVTDRSDGAGGASTRPLDAQAKAMPPPPSRRAAIPLEKGYSQVDWMRLARTHKDLAGLKGGPLRKNISLAEVAQHNTEGDAWTVFRGKVYNITPYMRFHPGGVPQLRRAMGVDCTQLFLKYHAWVNGDALLEKCLVGLLERPPLPA